MALISGQIYDDSIFESFGSIYHDFLWYTVTNDSPTLIKQPKNSNGPDFFHVIIKDSNPSTGYILKKGTNQNLFICYSNVSAIAIAYVDIEFKNWLTNSSHLHIFEQELTFEIQGTYTHAFVACNPNMDINSHTHFYITEYVAEYPHTQKYWVDPGVYPGVYDEVSYLASFTNYVDIRFFDHMPTFYNEETHTCEYPPIDPNTATTMQIPPNNSNILYAKNSYETNLQTFDCAINRLQQELQEEHNVRDILNNSVNDQVMIADIQSFIDTHTPEVNNKLSSVRNIQTELEILIPENLSKLQDNTDLNTLVNSQPATELSNKVFELDQAIHDAIDFLKNHNRYGTSGDIIYLYSQ